MKCAICLTSLDSGPARNRAFYNTRIKGWMCGICHQNAKDRLMAWLKYKKENKHDEE